MTETRRGSRKWDIENDPRGGVTLEFAEKFLIGTLLVHFDKHIGEIGDFDESKLHVDFHRAVFRAMMDLRSENLPVNAVSVAEQLQRTGKLDDFDAPMHYLIDLMDNSEGWAEGHVAEWCRIVWSKAAIRELKRDLKELDRLADTEPDTDSLRSRLSTLAGRFPKERHQPMTLESHHLEVATAYGRGEEPTLSIGIPDLDYELRGVAKGENVVIGGMTSHGKTLTAMQWMKSAASNQVPGLMITLEMSGYDLASRTLRGITNIPTGLWQTQNHELVVDIKTHYASQAPIHVAKGCKTIADVERTIESAVRDHGIGIACVDYAQLVRGEGSTREQQVGDVSRRFKQCLMKHNIIGLLLSQVNRQSARDARLPTLSDLRESGSIEQDADIVVFPFWEAKCNPKADPKLYRFIIAKNRKRGIRSAILEMQIDPEKQLVYPKESTFDAADRF